MNQQVVKLAADGISAQALIAVARHDAKLELTDSAYEAIDRSAAVIDRILANNEIVYGVTTGFGSLADTVIPPERSAELQVALLRSHAAGMGPVVEREVVRAMMALRARTLAMGFSGVRREVVEAMVAVLNAGLTPAVPEHGSLGASGDLAPLAHVAMCLIGEGTFIDAAGHRTPSREALQQHSIEPITLRAKEGLALINGTDGMLGMLVMAIDDLSNLSKIADIAAATTVEALMGTDRVFAEDLQELRPQVGQADSAANLRKLLADSEITASHRDHDTRVQDAYSLRCTPAVHGALRDTINHARAVASRELISAIDNPMILPDGRVESCGNFHGAPLAHVADFLAVSIADTAALSERRTDRMLDKTRSHGLPPFLAGDAGVDSGMMIAHYTQAAMVAETRRLATPASVDSIPTSALQEDHVSMGWGAVRKLRSAVTNLKNVLAVELVAASRGVELREPKPAPGVSAASRAIRELIPGVGPDRWLAPELELAADAIGDGRVVTSVEAAVGELA